MNIRKWHNQFSIDCDIKYQSKSTRSTYKHCVTKFLNYFAHYAEPKEIPNTVIKVWLLKFKTLNTRKQMLCSINAFYKLSVGMPRKIKSIPYPKKTKSLPKVIDKEYLIKQIDQLENLKHKAIISLAYSVGLRVSEVINLKITDIDSDRMIIHIRNSKGAKDRIVPLSEKILCLLRKYFLKYRPKEYLFNGQTNPQYTSSSMNKIVKKCLGNKYHFHQLRHSSLTAMVENGTNLGVVQKIAGHNNIKTTMIYTHISTDFLKQANTPL